MFKTQHWEKETKTTNSGGIQTNFFFLKFFLSSKLVSSDPNLGIHETALSCFHLFGICSFLRHQQCIENLHVSEINARIK